MAGAAYGGGLVRIADELCAELGYTGLFPAFGARSPLAEEGLMAGILIPADEALAGRLRMGLAKIAAALGFGPDGPRPQAVLAALDGAEMVIRGELMTGNADHLPRMMPSFVFLVALPIVEQDRALALSRRTAELISRASESP